MYDYDPNYYIADGCHNHHDKPMAPRPPFYGQFNVPYGPKPPICGCCHNHGKPNKLPPIKRPEHPESYYTNPPYIPSALKCNCEIPDRFPVSNVINVESQLVIALKIILYGVIKEDDKTVLLEYGKKYKILYLTETGVKSITGVLRYTDSRIPTDCLRYIGENNEVTDYAYIIIDGSTDGNSNIAKIFIRSLRGIEEVKPEEPTAPDDSNNESNSESSSESNSESTSESESKSNSDSSSESNSESTSESSSESNSAAESNSIASNSTSESESATTSESNDKSESEEKEIILTDENNITSDGKKFPKTPRPEVVYGGIFPTKEIIN